MKKSINRTLKWLTIPLVLFGIIQAVHLYAILHPEHFFEHEKKFGSFRVFSTQAIDPSLGDTLKEVSRRLESSEVYSSSDSINIVFASDGLYFTLAGRSPIPRTTGSCILIGGEVQIESNRIFLPAVEMNLAYVLTHESVHVGQHREHGLFMNTFFDFGRHPSWKTEGYAEWISQKDRLGDASSSTFSGLSLLDKAHGNSWVDLGDGYTMPASYLRDRIMVEYLIRIEGMKYSQIMETEISEADLWNRITNAEKSSNGNDG